MDDVIEGTKEDSSKARIGKAFVDILGFAGHRSLLPLLNSTVRGQKSLDNM